MDENDFPLDFILEPIEPVFDTQPLMVKKPPCPDGFIWRGREYRVVEEIEVWQDFKRRGNMKRNMRPGHIETALRRGSWGVGRFHYKVRVQDGRVYEIYYDRAPNSAGDRAGHWFLLGERRNS